VRENLAVLLLVGQVALVHWATIHERLPPIPDLARFPATLDQWSVLRESPIEVDVQRQLRADSLLSRDYGDPSRTSVVNVLVAWFQSQSTGHGQPHSPQVCLPGAGWVPELTNEVLLTTKDGVIAVNRYVVVNGGQRAVVLYWYQTPQRVVTGEWAAKLWAIASAIRDKRTDTALVRVVTWASASTNGVDGATVTAIGFGEELYQSLRERLPK